MAKKRTNHQKSIQAGNDRGTAHYADQQVLTGAGGEVHQTAGGNTPVLTTQQGIPVSDDQNSLRIGARGPTALEDFHLREKIFHFDHERIPERVVHARGFGAHGYFETYESLSAITKADLFRRKPALRFSLGGQQKCGPRDVRICKKKTGH
jgi:catalase